MGVPAPDRLRIGFDRLRCNLLNLAELIFLGVLDETPGEPTALRLLGVTRAKMGRPGAVEHLKAAAAAAPEVEVIWSDLAVALREAGDAAGAADAYARTLALRDPAAGTLPPLEALSFATERDAHRFELADYPYVATVRHGAGRPPHPGLTAILEAGRRRYAAMLEAIGDLASYFGDVAMGGRYEADDPFWLNTWFPALDGMALTAMLKAHEPARFVEIGSGVSTKFARRAVRRFGLRTKLISIDPQPRNQIDRLCDQVIRKPLEQCDPAMFDALQPGDILFLDSSHRAFQGSDVTVFFTEILPRLKPGVIVQVHDVYLPEDYISGHLRQLWNEQYLLATALLFGPERFEVLFPAWWVGRDPELRAQARAVVGQGPLTGLDPYGASFWMRMR
ncbi:class I SAM-dependent methyltransferase [Phenylobacterium sp.]|uniref:class I SAM-dependent methyltransferase n=1 Tax=Phenylobacterium sp. TaxID=1871053 RepID=UPI00301D893B